MNTRASYRALLLAGLLAACGDSAPSLPMDHPRPEPFQPAQLKALVDVAAAPAFADQTGGGIFATAAGEAIRLRLDGTRAVLENHPGNAVTPGRVRAVFRMGTSSALVEADNGLFLAQSGWLIAPSWRDALGPGLAATASTPDGAAWLGHASGLYQLKEGTLSALKLDGKALEGITALVAAPTDTGATGLWFLRQDVVWLSVRTATGAWRVSPAPVTLLEGERPMTLVGLGASEKGKAEVWLLTSRRLLRRGVDGWRQVGLARKPTQVLAAGRFVWVKAGEALLSYDADADRWGEASGVDTREFRFLAADESGCAWVQLGADTVALSRGPVPRVLGLHEGMQVVEDTLVVRARLVPGVEPVSVSFEVAGVEVPVHGPSYSLGGVETDGTPKPYSFVGLEPGPHTLSAVARYVDGTEARRAVAFEYQPLSTVALGWQKDIRPLHESRCARCHQSGPGRPLSSYELWRDNVPLIVAAVREQRMPADGPLDPQLISLIQRWAATGANP
ncbi:MAG TPA: hypothetical protein VF794_24375 [Archangium sp.]|jgi:hypothetical protein|uniref:hypothetical protein n=1 Tax=Archangium sp. TaxID=1872627 RepID=UPI002ED80D14